MSVIRNEQEGACYRTNEQMVDCSILARVRWNCPNGMSEVHLAKKGAERGCEDVCVT